MDFNNKENNNNKKKNNDYTDNDNTEDKNIYDNWDKKEEELENKLGEVINLLDEIKEMNDNLSRDIDIRDKLIRDNKNEAQKVNKALEIHNKNLVELLEKYRASSKMCLDFCMCLLIKNGN